MSEREEKFERMMQAVLNSYNSAAEKIFVELKNLKIAFEITPELLAKYPELIGCKYF